MQKKQHIKSIAKISKVILTNELKTALNKETTEYPATPGTIATVQNNPEKQTNTKSRGGKSTYTGS